MFAFELVADILKEAEETDQWQDGMDPLDSPIGIAVRRRTMLRWSSLKLRHSSGES